MSFKNYVKDATKLIAYRLAGLLVLFVGALLFITPIFWNSELPEFLHLPLMIIGVIILIIGGLFTRYSYKRIESQYNI